MVEITLIPKEEKAKFFIGKFLLPVVFGLLAASIIIAFSFFFYKSTLEKTLSMLENDLIALESQRDKVLEEKLLDLQTNIEYAGPLLENHIMASRLFQFLEEQTHPQVRYLAMDIDFEGAVLNLRSKAASLQVISQQVERLKENPDVKQVEMSQLNLNIEGGVDFGLQISLAPKFFKF